MIRRAAPADLATLLELCAEFCEMDDHPFDPAGYEAGLRPLLSDDTHGMVWLVDDDAGYVVVTWGWSLESGGPDALLDEFYVRRRSEGLGSTVMAEVVTAVRERGARRIFLETERPNEAARRFYRRSGFTEDDSVWLSLDL
ncbi:MAG: GNAT family N-acetyltransferase [Acidimicrobiia bacterium]